MPDELRRVLIAGSSMSPTLEVGDVVRVRANARVGCGDVVVFETRDEPICHRIVLSVPWPGGPRFVHKGDAARARCGVVGVEAVVGLVVDAERSDGTRFPVPARSPHVREVLRAVLTLARAFRSSDRR